PEDVDLGLAAADVRDVLLEHLGDNVGGLESRVPRRQQLVGFRGGGRDECKDRARKGSWHKALHGRSPCVGAGRSCGGSALVGWLTPPPPPPLRGGGARRAPRPPSAPARRCGRRAAAAPASPRGRTYPCSCG